MYSVVYIFLRVFDVHASEFCHLYKFLTFFLLWSEFVEDFVFPFFCLCSLAHMRGILFACMLCLFTMPTLFGPQSLNSIFGHFDPNLEAWIAESICFAFQTLLTMYILCVNSFGCHIIEYILFNLFFTPLKKCIMSMY